MRSTDFCSTASLGRSVVEILADLGAKLDAVLSFVVDEDVVVERMLSRGRADDKEDVIRNRLNVYRDETAPLLDHYSDQILSVDAMGEVDEVSARALKSIEGLGK
jgi:adenylate kinase